jgi:hypothetical protein
VGDQVISAGVLYICILGVGPTATAPAADPTHWTAQGSPSGSLPSGLTAFSALTWTLDGTNGFYSAPLTGVSALLTTTSKLSTTLQMLTGYTAANVGTAAGAWLIAAYPSSAAGGTITFFVSSSGVPTGETKIALSWAIASF